MRRIENFTLSLAQIPRRKEHLQAAKFASERAWRPAAVLFNIARFQLRLVYLLLGLSVKLPRLGMVMILPMVVIGDLPVILRGQSHRIEKARDGLQEAGSPLFSILSTETLGLKSPPTDLHIMPDGRVLVVAGSQLAFGDGVRWEVFNQSANDPIAGGLSVGVDTDGSIYQGIQGGFARVTFGENGHWRLVKVADWPIDETYDRPVPHQVMVAGSQWFWHNKSGPITSWRPGQAARSFGSADVISLIFQLRDDFYLSQGDITLLEPGDSETAKARKEILSDALLTCAQPYKVGQLLVGTTIYGLQLFDGHTLRPFPGKGILTEGLRINSLCLVGGGNYAAAVENFGVVFFDKDGRTIQSLNRTLDHRLSRVQQLISGPNGVVWGLVSDGIFRVEFPSRVSYFDPIINSGFSTVHPDRADGRLWLYTENQLLRANYETDGRLSGFAGEKPPIQSIFSFSCNLGVPVAASAQGSYYWNKSGWIHFAPQTINQYILQDKPIDGQWLYCAENEIGWMSRAADGLEIQRHSGPRVGKVYDSVTDDRGNIWLEFGAGQVGRIGPCRPADGFPAVEIFDAKQGVPDGWVQVFIVDGVVRFNISDRILRLDDSGSHLVPDVEFTRISAELGMIVGRPGRDSLGHLWITNEKGVHIFSGELTKLQRIDEPMPAGFQPTYFTFESGGVVWMHSARHLVRYDPHMSAPVSQPLRALITYVDLPNSGRTSYPSNGRLPTLT